jgi:hypothetical protein
MIFVQSIRKTYEICEKPQKLYKQYFKILPAMLVFFINSEKKLRSYTIKMNL